MCPTRVADSTITAIANIPSNDLLQTVIAHVYHRAQSWQNHAIWPPARNSYAVTMPYNDVQLHRRYCNVYCTWKNTITGVVTTREYWFQPNHATPTPSAGDLLPDYDDMWIQLRSRIKGIDWNLGVFLAEGRKTADMILNTAVKFGAAYRNVRKGRVRDAFRTLGIDAKQMPRKVNSKDVANRYLEATYGWRPLVSDVQSAAKYAASLLFEKQVLRRVRVRKFGEGVVTQYIAVLDEGTIPGHKLWMRLDTKFTFERSHGCLIRKLTSAIPEGLGFDSPALVAWELVPFSFVVDWFINIGNWLEAAGALLGVDVVDVWSSTTVVKKTDCSFFYEKTVSTTTTVAEGLVHKNRLERGRVHYEERDYVRVRHFDIPLPLPTVSNDPLTFRRLITSLALLRQKQR